MAGVLESVNSRTQLVGENRLELLLFRLATDQIYGINVFKVKEVLQCPHLYELPKRNPVVRGVAHIRGGTVSILDMNHATGHAPLDDIDNSFVIIAEYNRTIQGFLVRSVERIVNLNWEDVHPPPKGAGNANYLTAVTEVEGKLVEIIDVEKILAEISPLPEDVSEDFMVDDDLASQCMNRHILIVDDSTIARKQVQRVVESLGVTTTTLKDGREAFNYLKQMIEDGKDPNKELILIISDIEMPEMDGYTFTAAVRNTPELKDLHIILHTSLSGVFNEAMVSKVGADDFIAKFYPDDIASRVNQRIQYLVSQGLLESDGE
ncbi:chemotaxis protein CheV [Aurantivibrio plasticivorans]